MSDIWAHMTALQAVFKICDKHHYPIIWLFINFITFMIVTYVVRMCDPTSLPSYMFKLTKGRKIVSTILSEEMLWAILI